MVFNERIRGIGAMTGDKRTFQLPGIGRIKSVDAALVLLLIALAAAYSVYGLRQYDVVSADGAGYASSGKAFFKTGDPRCFGTLFPPLYPFLVGLFNLALDNLETSARMVSVFFNALTLIPLYGLALDLWGRRAALCASILFITLPFLHGMSGIDITEPTYTFFALAAAWAFRRCLAARGKGTAFAAGALLGIAYLARPEGFIVAAAFAGILLLLLFLPPRKGWMGQALLLAVFWCGFLVPAAPYMNYLHNVTGAWQLSGKTGLNSSIIREYRGETPPDQHMRLNEQGQEVGGGNSTLLDLMKESPDIFWGNIRDNLHALPRELAGTFPWFLFVLSCIGYLWLPRYEPEDGGERAAPARQGLMDRLLLASVCSPLALYVVYFVQPRGFYAYVPVFLMATGGGLARIDSWVRRITPLETGIVLPIVAVLGLWYVYSGIPAPKPPYHYTQDGARYDDKQVGLRLRSIIPPGATIITRSGRIGFYSQRAYLMPPQGSLAEIIAFADKNHADYLIATIQLLSMRPQLEILYQPLFGTGGNAPPLPGIEAVYIGQEPGGLPYIVYRFVRQ
ncbi:glycosyl transferase family 39 [Geobacter metallireducens RCH3]|nr:glycosyl transferase family 39 [Geobacter metallireducens RCH3]